MTRILVTGAQGLLGSTLVPYLQARGYDLVRNDRHGEGDARVELTDMGQVGFALDKIVPEVIVNLAALTDVDECERNPQHAYQANVRIVGNLVKWIQNSASSCYLVQLSTDQVYDGTGPHKEDDLTLSNYYGFSKYAGELLAAAVPSTIVRTNFFGPSQCKGRTSLTDWLVASAKQGRAITVFEEIRFSPLSLRRLVQLLEIVIARRQHGVFNIGSKDGMSKADFAYAFAEVLNLPAEHMSRGTAANAKRAAYRPVDMRMDSSRFEDAFSVELPALKEELETMKAAYADETR